MVQQVLVDQGTDLRKQYKIKNAILLASAGPAGVPWFVEDSWDPSLVFCDASPVGCYYYFPPEFWPWSHFFSMLTFAPVPGTPTAAEIVTNGWHSIEPEMATRQLFGSGLPRPFVESGIFGPDSKTTLNVIVCEADANILPYEQEILYEYLTGDSDFENLIVVPGGNAVHMLHMTNPEHLLEAIAGIVAVP
jgi:hypothetical protein